MTGQTIGQLLVMIIYLILMVGIGVLYSKKNNDVSDFYLGGRKLGPIVTAMSAEASDMSSWLLMGLPGVAYLSGCAEAGWTAIGLAIGTYLNWLIVAKRLRRYTHKANNSITLPAFFENRYRDKSHALMAISAIMIVIFFVPYTASGFAACGKLFSTLFGVSYLPAMIISAIVIVLYTTLGGFLAASMTDLIQSIIMTIALFIVVIFGIHTAGGFDAVIANAKSMNGYLSLFSSYDPAAADLPCHCGRMRQHHGRRRAAVSLAAEFERRDSQFREGNGRHRLCALEQGRNRHAGGRGAAFVCAHAARAGRHHAGALRRGQKARAQVLRVVSALFVCGERIRRGCQGVRRGPVRFYPAGNADRRDH